jgi:FTR1 family protein
MKRARRPAVAVHAVVVAWLLLPLGVVGAAGGQDAARPAPEPAGIDFWLSAVRAGLASAAESGDTELETAGVGSILRLYLDHYEPLESWYGPGAPHGVEPLASAVARGETRFHALMRARTAPAMRLHLRELQAALDTVTLLARETGVPRALTREVVPAPVAGRSLSAELRSARTPEIATIVAALRSAAARWHSGDAEGALALVEQAYLQSFEPLEARLPGAVTREVESLIHLRLRPQLARSAPAAEVAATFEALYASLAKADVALAGGTTFWFGAANAFVILVREGLEAVLLIAAILAYLKGSGAPVREQKRVFAGAGLGIAATFATWLAARTILPVSGAGREMMEGVTALVAVAVLLWVSHWLFQKTYMDDWKTYLRSKVGQAVTTGSALAMAGLAFAAVYREGFETVLFYQALMFDASSTAVLAGFVPGLALIVGLGIAVLRLGVRLPLRTLFGITNFILLYLAFVFLGKGIYNLQEAGVFAPRPIGWLPDHGALRQLLGFYPLAETVLAQAGFLSLLAATWVFYVYRRKALAVAASPALPD